MTLRTVQIAPHWEAFRGAARTLALKGIPPERVAWTEVTGDASQLSLLPTESPENSPVAGAGSLRVPAAFLEAGETVACHRDPAPWPWLYRILWRIHRGQRWLLEDAADPDVSMLRTMERAVRSDAHRMTAFLRFRRATDAADERYVAWFEPRHRVVRRTAPFFQRRFPSMRWSILTPDECVHWDGGELFFTAGVDRSLAPAGDSLESSWLTYYAHTFNPARVRASAMRAEMPQHYWRNMPETAGIDELIRAAPGRVRAMIEQAGSAEGKAAGVGAEPRRVTSEGAPAPQSFEGSQPAAEAAPAANTIPVSARPLRVASEQELRLPAGDLQPVRVPGVRVGVAGWDYPDWAGRVYPSGRKGVDRLRWVAARFDLLEVNSTFYRPASERVVRGWLERTADRLELRFSAKLSRRFTHDRGAWSDAEVDAVTRGMVPLLESGRLLSLVVQFPWSFRAGPDERRHLARIVQAFARFPLHIEVRHASWEIPAFHRWLGDRGVGLVEIDQPTFPDSIGPASRTTSPVGYVRLHGRNARDWFRADATRDERYDYRYTADELQPWLARVGEMSAREQVDEVAVVFNNHYRAQAVDNAEWFASALRSRLTNGASA